MRDRKSDTHRTRTEKELGRKLATDEVVHHKDEDKENNAADNREVKPRGVHSSEHNANRGLSQLRKSLRMVREGKKLY